MVRATRSTFERNATTMPSWVRPGWRTGVRREGEPVLPQDAQHPLGIDARFAARAQGPVHQRGDAAIAVARAGIDDRADRRQQCASSGLW